MSSIVGPSLDSVLPRTILPMEVAMVSRYTDPVELSWTILLVLLLEILGVILSTADTSVDWLCRLQHSCIGCSVGKTLEQGRRPPYHHCSGGWKCQHCGSPGKWIGGQVGAMWRNGQALPCSLSILSCQGIPIATGVFSCPLVGGPSTQLNRVTGAASGYLWAFPSQDPPGCLA